MKIFSTLLLLMVFLSPSAFAIGVDWNSNVITAIGVGSAPEYAIKPGQADALARRAAVVDAYRNLASIVYGVEIENHTTVAQLVVKKDTIKTAVAGVIKNARIVDEESLDNSNYQVTISMPLFGPNSLSSAIWSNRTLPTASEDDEGFPFTNYNPPTTNTTNTTGTAATAAAVTTSAPTSTGSTVVMTKPDPATLPAGAFTGLVVDCRGLGLERAMAPNIIDTNGRTIYSSQNIKDAAIIQHGLVTYAKTDNPSELTNAGPKPLMIRALSLNDFQQNPVIKKEDGDNIQLAIQQYDFMKTCSVVFIQ